MRKVCIALRATAQLSPQPSQRHSASEVWSSTLSPRSAREALRRQYGQQNAAATTAGTSVH